MRPQQPQSSEGCWRQQTREEARKRPRLERLEGARPCSTSIQTSGLQHPERAPFCRVKAWVCGASFQRPQAVDAGAGGGASLGALPFQDSQGHTLERVFDAFLIADATFSPASTSAAVLRLPPDTAFLSELGL